LLTEFAIGKFRRRWGRRDQVDGRRRLRRGGVLGGTRVCCAERAIRAELRLASGADSRWRIRGLRLAAHGAGKRGCHKGILRKAGRGAGFIPAARPAEQARRTTPGVNGANVGKRGRSGDRGRLLSLARWKSFYLKRL